MLEMRPVVLLEWADYVLEYGDYNAQRRQNGENGETNGMVRMNG
jgi:hypothetical protein